MWRPLIRVLLGLAVAVPCTVLLLAFCVATLVEPRARAAGA